MESRRAARRKPAYALAASRKNWRRYDEARQDRQSLQTDPVGYEDDLNLYQYVGNDPLTRSDPTGRETRFGNMLMSRDTDMLRDGVDGNGFPEDARSPVVTSGGKAEKWLVQQTAS